MAQSSTCYILSQNLPLGGKDEFIGIAFNKDNNTPVILCIPTPALVIVPATTLSSIAQYLENDLEQILRTVLDSTPPLAPTSTFVIA